MDIPLTEYSYEATRRITENVIHFDKPMISLTVDLNAKDVPHNSMHHSPQHTKNLYDIVVFAYKMFKCRGYLTEAFLIQKSYLLPKEVETEGLETGYLFLVVFEEELFMDNFPLIVKAAVAVNHGFLYDEAAWVLPLEEIAQKLERMNLACGTNTVSKKVKNTTKVGDIQYLSDLDSSLASYHLHGGHIDRHTVIDHALYGKDILEAWNLRIRLLSPTYLYEFSRRMLKKYKELLRLASLISVRAAPDVIIDDRVTHRLITNVGCRLPENNSMTRLYTHHSRQFTWVNVMARTPDGGMSLDLRGVIAWHVMMHHVLSTKHFYTHRFYELPPISIDTSEYQMTQSEEDRLAIYQKNLAMTNFRDFEKEDKGPELYPTLSLLKSVFGSLLNSYGKTDVCQMYLTKMFGSFLIGTYNDLMLSDTSQMSRAREQQYKVLPGLVTDVFPAANLNASRDRVSGKFQVKCGRMFLDVEPYQDIMASQLLEMAMTTGVCHLAVELYTFLISNIIGFTPWREKSHIVLDGPTGAGKSYTAKASQLISQGVGTNYENKYACADEHYSTTRSFTVSASDPYETVLGQRLNEEWKSGEGKNNPFLNNTTLESVTLKNIFDTGLSINQRCQIKKDKRGDERIVRGKDYALDDRSAIILANGFKVCSSVKNRVMVFHIPDMNVRVNIRSTDALKKALCVKNIPQFFSLMRCLITDEVNREYLDMDLKLYDSSEDIDHREVNLTFNRMQDVLEDMGFIAKDILTTRRRQQILHFASIIAHWRSVVEVYGSVQGDSTLERKNDGESHEDYLERVITSMTAFLTNMTPVQKAKRQAQRCIVDPSDILSAATMTVQLTEPDRQLMKVISSHLVNPSDYEDVEPWKEPYLVIENINLSTICEELKRQKMKVLDESLGGLLGKLEDKYVKNRMPCVIRKTDTGAINRSKEKRYQVFNLYVNAEYAAKLYTQEHGLVVNECIELFTDHLLRVTGGEVKCEWRSKTGQILYHSGNIVLNIPKHLKKAFDYMYHLCGNKKVVDSCDAAKSDDGYSVALNPDFGQARTRALRAMLIRKLRENGSVNISDNGYVAIESQNTEVFGQKCEEAVRDVCEGWDANPTLVSQVHGNWQVHISIFNAEYDNTQGVTDWRKVITATNLEKGIFARKGYFMVSPTSVGPMREIPNRAKFDTSVCSTPVFARHREKKTVIVHLSILREMPLMQGIVEEKSNLVKTWVEKCLCKNMTDYSTVMVFDREKVYETQNVLDSISFVNPQDVAFRRHDGELPVFKMKENEDIGKSDDGFKSTTESLTRFRVGEGYDSFHPLHRKRKLAYKHLIANGDLVTIWQKHKTSQDKNARKKFRMDMETAIGNVLDEVDSFSTPVSKYEEILPFPEHLRQAETEQRELHDDEDMEDETDIDTDTQQVGYGKRKRDDDDDDHEDDDIDDKEIEETACKRYKES